jgi:hypothetical protein
MFVVICPVSATMTSKMTAGVETDALDIDPIWTTSRTARQIYALGEVEKVRKINTWDTEIKKS